MNFLNALLKNTSVADRWMAVVMAMVVLVPALGSWSRNGGQRAVIHVPGLDVEVWPLNRDQIMQKAGKLGPVQIEIRKGRVRLLEYESARLVGTRTGWIDKPGQISACIPCGVWIQIDGERTPPRNGQGSYDGIAR